MRHALQGRAVPQVPRGNQHGLEAHARRHTDRTRGRAGAGHLRREKSERYRRRQRGGRALARSRGPLSGMVACVSSSLVGSRANTPTAGDGAASRPLTLQPSPLHNVSEPAAVETERLLMANVKKGQTVRAPEWWKHLRWTKRQFWKRQRQADKEICHGSSRADPAHGAEQGR